MVNGEVVIIEMYLNPLRLSDTYIYIYIIKHTIIGSDNGLAPGWCQAIFWTNDGMLLIWPLGTNFSEILIEIHIFLFKKMHLKMLSGKWRPFLSQPQCVKECCRLVIWIGCRNVETNMVLLYLFYQKRYIYICLLLFLDINKLELGRKLKLRIDIFSISCEIALTWMPKDFTDD